MIMLTVFFILMTPFNTIGLSILSDSSAEIALRCALGLSVLLPTRFIIHVKGGRYE